MNHPIVPPFFDVRIWARDSMFDGIFSSSLREETELKNTST